MAYTSIYRKYRPDTFSNVIGQDHIITTLKNQIVSGLVGHAYIFTGTRGTGKTSVAKIFAKAVNCPHPLSDGSPCGVCSVCAELKKPTNFDIIELDAASNNSVEQIRELTDKINFPPTIGRFKVYIIDEVHMLSKSAFNALLKTLEEPPVHAIFILATTEIHQIPQTILSRCMRFDFRLVASAVLAKHIKKIFDDMGVGYELNALKLIAEAGGGSVRDSLSIADMCVSFSEQNVTYDSVIEVLGSANPNDVIALAGFIVNGDTKSALEIVATLADNGKNIASLRDDLVAVFRNIMFLKTCPNSAEIFDMPSELTEKLAGLSKLIDEQRCLDIMRQFGALEGEFRYTSQHRILLEATIVGATLNLEDNRIALLENKVRNLEGIIQNIKKSGFRSAPAQMDARQVWNSIASALKDRGYPFLSFAFLDSEYRETETEFILKAKTKQNYDMLTEHKNRDVIVRIFNDLSDKKIVFEETKTISVDDALPFIQSMFKGNLEIK